MKNELIASMSQIGQDKFVANLLQHKEKGYFIDIGAGHPIDINNTYSLEKELEWNGISFDYGPPYTHKCEKMSEEEYMSFWKAHRNTELILGDARNHDFKKIFLDHSLDKVIDYLSIDLEPPAVTLQVLKMLPLHEYRFRVITFEHDFYREKTTIEPSRKLFASLGYELVKTVNNQEDWYVDKNLI